jgi:NitT/TauT family transport system permease protein
VWQVIAALGLIPYTFIPSPLEIGASLIGTVADGTIWAPLLHTLGAVLASWVIAVVAGVAVGLLMGFFGPVWFWTNSSAEMLRTVPAVALVPVALLIFGFAVQTEIVVAAFVALWPVVISTAVAVRRTHPQLRDVGRSFRLSRGATGVKLLLPAAYPAIVVAARLALTIAVILVVLTEMIGVPEGLGYELTTAQQTLQPATMWAYLFVIAVMGLALQFTLALAARAFMPGWAPQLSTVGR